MRVFTFGVSSNSTRLGRVSLKLSSLLRRFIGWNKQLSYAFAERWPRLFATRSYNELLRTRIADSLRDAPEAVLEVGGVDRPILTKHGDFEYVGVDIEDKPSCYDVYDRFLVQSVEDPIHGRYGLIISTTLMEHVPDNRAAVRSMFEALTPGGATHHYVPSKWHPYSIALRAVGPVWQARLIPLLRPGSEEETGYPAFFDHCTGRSMRKLFEEVGFERIEVEYFYWATDYFSFLAPLYFLVNLYEQLCDRLGLGLLGSGFVISARKPSSRATR